MDTPTGAVNAADFQRWNRQLREGDGLSYLDQLQLNNLVCVLRDKYLELVAQYTTINERLIMIEGPLNDLARSVMSYRRGGLFPADYVAGVVWGLVEDLRDLENRE